MKLINIVILLLLTLVSACESDDDTAEKAGESIDTAMEKIGNSLDALDQDGSMENAGEAIDEAVDKAKPVWMHSKMLDLD